MKTCPKCHKTFPDRSRFCPMDGSALETLEDSGKSEMSHHPHSNNKRIPPEEVVTKPLEKPPVEIEDEKKRFSETKWFMLGDKMAEDDLEPDDIKIEELQARYMKTEELPTEIREKYSLEYQKKKKTRKE